MKFRKTDNRTLKLDFLRSSQASLATAGSITDAAYESYMESMNGLIFNDLDEQRSCDHIGCGLQGMDAQALKAVNTFKMGIKAATNMRSDDLWEISTNANYLDLAASQGYGVIANIDDWDQVRNGKRTRFSSYILSTMIPTLSPPCSPLSAVRKRQHHCKLFHNEPPRLRLAHWCA